MNYARLDALERQQSDKNFARSQLQQAVRKGIVKKEPCICGETNTQAHHADYKKPLDVMWACKKHHVELDKLRLEQDPNFTL